MNIYHISRTDQWSYDDYDSFIVVSKDEETAKSYNPNGNVHDYKEDRWRRNGWVSRKEDIVAIHMGIANSDLPEGFILCASFNAG